MRILLLQIVWLAVAVELACFGGDPVTKVPLGLDEFIPVPEDNPQTGEKIELGRRLFFDKQLSRDGTIACATCHLPERALTDAKPVAVGIEGRPGRRNAPSLFNRAYGKAFFWDGRVKSLEEQPLTAITNRNEMDLTLPEFEFRLDRNRDYSMAFGSVFGERPHARNAAKALATFVRTLLSGNSPFDRFEHGDQNALSDAAKRGLQIFRGKGNCIPCHSGPLLSDEEFHNTGVSWGKEPLDLGRFEVTKREQDRGKFKTATLRNIALTAPYMHDGSLATLDDVIEFYSKGALPNPSLDREVRPLNLHPEEKVDLITFLKCLSGELQIEPQL
ncbi:MAG: cytochrome-c peroxidase [Pedosphaera sp.]|nr:cytochrome-c peroxidase [Pedosphaera sp.]